MNVRKFGILALASKFLSDNQKACLNQVKQNQDAYQSLMVVVDKLPDKEKFSVIIVGLEFWRMQFQRRPIQYVGDAIYYEMFSTAMRKGLSLEEAACEVESIISREMYRGDRYREWQRNYVFNWNLQD
ncbi:hypothetical protein [Chryseobacterium caseinilyticum]|uniref:Uncharacterized protein n=1 Tax=Chryseobacterium caseinilyticum TaxID=2771428 RepID=A0ABR8Z777_9FLAO|nr:hypothetical protein [Chryseobacterium caseinilyticum]MBD8081144.1 hypothetical protein [Chryseobacterium caseinilyticum]